MGFVCHVEHPHKFISNYLATLGAASPELSQEAWNLANDRYYLLPGSVFSLLCSFCFRT
ncbi:CYCL1-1 [Linum grandiflorum]